MECARVNIGGGGGPGGQDASRLVDICRQSIVFDTAGGVAACLRAVAAGREAAALLRVKNWRRLARARDGRGRRRGTGTRG